MMHPASILDLGSPEAWAGVVWRTGRAALRLRLAGRSDFEAHEAKELGLCDAVSDLEPDAWLAGWMRNRSAMALDSAAALIRARGGDRLERAAFALLFAAGEPQASLPGQKRSSCLSFRARRSVPSRSRRRSGRSTCSILS